MREHQPCRSLLHLHLRQTLTSNSQTVKVRGWSDPQFWLLEGRVPALSGQVTAPCINTLKRYL